MGRFPSRKYSEKQPIKKRGIERFLRGEKPCNCCDGMVASPLAAAVVAAILRCEL